VVSIVDEKQTKWWLTSSSTGAAVSESVSQANNDEELNCGRKFGTAAVGRGRRSAHTAKKHFNNLNIILKIP
jgi:hypothetical protein